MTAARLTPDMAKMSAAEQRALLTQLLSRRTDQPHSYPLSFAQQRLWFLDRLNAGSPAYNIPGAFDLSGPLDVAALTEALNDLVARHAPLRTVFAEIDGKPVQTVLPTLHVALPLVDAVDEDAARSLVDAEVAKPFDLRETVFRARLIRLTPYRHVLIVVLHHICADGWSLAVFNRDLAAAYAARRDGQDPNLAPLGTDYASFSVAQRTALSGTRLHHLLDFWKAKLAGLPVIDLPLDRPRPALAKLRGDSIDVSLEPDLIAAASELARQQSTTLYCVLLAAFRAVLGRIAGQTDFAIGAPVAGRTDPALENLIGFFVNTLAIRVDLAQAKDFSHLVRLTRETMIQAQARQDLPFEKLVDDLNLPRDTSRNPLVQVLFALQNAPMLPLQLEGLSTAAFPYRLPAARFDLELHLWDGRQSWTGARDVDAGLTGTLFYNSDLFDRATMTDLLRMLKVWLAAALATPDRPLASYPLLDAAAQAGIIATGDGGPAPDVDLPALLEKARVRFGERCALHDGCGQDLTYDQLYDRADRIGSALCARGLTAGDVVALVLPRGRDLVAAMLACARFGFPFAPVDPELPPLRLTQQIALAGAALVLCADEHGADAAISASCTTIGTLIGNIGRDVIARPNARNHAPLYIVFTSGSTGTPKGVRMPMRAFANLMASQLAIRPQPMRTLLASAVGFDVAIQEVLFTLSTGGVLIPATEAQRRDPQQLAALIAREQIERVFLPFPLIALLARGVVTSGQRLVSLREIITAGEQPHLTDEVRRLFTGHPGLRLINQYGPAETHVVSEEVLDGDASHWPMLPSAGRALPGNRLYVLDAEARLQPYGLAGELCIAGVQVADGYLGGGALADRFVADPFAADARMYRTGDLVKLNRDGRLAFLGRRDNQIKIRGYRVEPGEIEVVLAAHPGVTDCAVVAERDGGGHRHLVACVVPGSPAFVPHALRDWLRPRLPDYMMPARFLQLDALPLSANGKVDRAALTAAGRPFASSSLDQPAPRSATEQAIAAIWSAVLRRDDVDVDSTFFELGGNSLLLVEAYDKLVSSFAVPLAIADLFQFPTVAALARHIDAAAQPAAVSTATGIRGRALRMRGEGLR
ncbi:Putative Non-ribosomal peptide synthetase/polyketide synthase [Bradyrhizobium sp. ORS 285]|uniref:non-ribosomal peptide synthetase n=1 Tax=Bradyrhizobium sp. ORS 285 TaxID=115808 RepID=UPI0002406CA0|nr:non-ribosomal peptide synthetase [Bradyrhizobium sp. ORS 285]CCD83731.1 putative Non-ribosomal peptide synthetase/polyketide synthase [Bradyrhizobium sp. ORS 285]SMX59277.1 Putative Non-ribosomal peptide synthetase/polyketide synthase [Bradyrhizobium sp. ORS 285]